uniref:Uncharacterized protein n=1 Tax=Arundo donax TaxID=35708 RepID=A0A0A9GXN1_ARUDO
MLAFFYCSCNIKSSSYAICFQFTIFTYCI